MLNNLAKKFGLNSEETISIIVDAYVEVFGEKYRPHFEKILHENDYFVVDELMLKDSKISDNMYNWARRQNPEIYNKLLEEFNPKVDLIRSKIEELLSKPMELVFYKLAGVGVGEFSIDKIKNTKLLSFHFNYIADESRGLKFYLKLSNRIKEGLVKDINSLGYNYTPIEDILQDERFVKKLQDVAKEYQESKDKFDSLSQPLRDILYNCDSDFDIFQEFYAKIAEPNEALKEKLLSISADSQLADGISLVLSYGVGGCIEEYVTKDNQIKSAVFLKLSQLQDDTFMHEIFHAFGKCYMVDDGIGNAFNSHKNPTFNGEKYSYNCFNEVVTDWYSIKATKALHSKNKILLSNKEFVSSYSVGFAPMGNFLDEYQDEIINAIVNGEETFINLIGQDTYNEICFYTNKMFDLWTTSKTKQLLDTLKTEGMDFGLKCSDEAIGLKDAANTITFKEVNFIIKETLKNRNRLYNINFSANQQEMLDVLYNLKDLCDELVKTKKQTSGVGV